MEAGGGEKKRRSFLATGFMLLLLLGILGGLGFAGKLLWGRFMGDDQTASTLQGGTGTVLSPPAQTAGSAVDTSPDAGSSVPVALEAGEDGWATYNLSGVDVSVPGKVERDRGEQPLLNPPGAKSTESYHSVFGGVRVRIAKTAFDASPEPKPLLDQLASSFSKQMKDGPQDPRPRIGRAEFKFRKQHPAQRIWTRFGDTGRYADVWHVVHERELVTVSVSGNEREAREISERLMKSLTF